MNLGKACGSYAPALQYHVYLSQNPEDIPLVATVTTNSYTPPMGLEHGSWYWRVTADNGRAISMPTRTALC